MSDLTILYTTAHKIPEKFASNVLKQLYRAAGTYTVYETHGKASESSITNYYRALLEAAKTAATPYIAFAEDDTLYCDEHFNQRPSDLHTFAYNTNRWNLYTWSEPPFFSLRQRKILATLIAPREKFIEVMEKRLENPDEKRMVEPGRVDGECSETFDTYKPIIVFTHPDSFGYAFQGKRKRASRIRALELPYWGTAQRVMEFYEWFNRHNVYRQSYLRLLYG